MVSHGVLLRLAPAVVCALMLGGQVLAQTTPAGRNEPITLNFVNADIEAVARTMATVTGLGVVVDPRVKGTISLVTEKPVSRAAAMNQFLATLRLQGYTMVETGGIYKVLPEADAKLQSASVGVSTGGAAVRAGSNQIITQIIKLNHENANNLVPIQIGRAHV